MSDSEVLRELSSSLSEKERVDLLEKIKKSLHISDGDEEKIIAKPLDSKQRDKKIREEISQCTLLTRIILWLKTLFSGKDKKEVFLGMKIQSLKKRIQRKTPGVTGFETRDLTPKLAEAFLTLYVKVHPVVPLFQKLWKSPHVFERIFTAILERMFEHPKENIEDLISIETLESVYEKEGKKESIKREVVNAIESYIKTIPDDIIESLEKDMLPLYYMKDLVLFPFNEFFQFFHYTPDLESKRNLFKSASAMLALKHLEKMYYAVYTIGKIEEPVRLSKQMLDQLEIVNEVISENREGEEERDEETSENEETNGNPDSQIIDTIAEVSKVAKRFGTSIPLVELIKYFKQDPYYRLMVYVPKLELKDFYASVLKMRFLPQIDKKFYEIRKHVIDKRIQELFEGVRLRSFRYYRVYSSLEYEKLGLPVFTNIQTLTLLYNFLDIVYRNIFQETINILSRNILQQNRLTLNRLLVYAGEAEDVHDKIQYFDNSLSPDEGDGKLFQRLRFSLGSNTAHQRLYRNLIIQKDREVNAIITKGKDSLSGIKKVFTEILSNPTQTVKEKLNVYYFVRDNSVTLKNLLMKCLNDIDIFNRLMYQLDKLENGS